MNPSLRGVVKLSPSPPEGHAYICGSNRTVPQRAGSLARHGPNGCQPGRSGEPRCGSEPRGVTAPYPGFWRLKRPSRALCQVSIRRDLPQTFRSLGRPPWELQRLGEARPALPQEGFETETLIRRTPFLVLMPAGCRLLMPEARMSQTFSWCLLRFVCLFALCQNRRNSAILHYFHLSRS